MAAIIHKNLTMDYDTCAREEDATTSVSLPSITQHPHEEDRKSSSSSDSTSSATPEARTDAAEAIDIEASIRALKEELSHVPHDEKSALVHVQRVAPDLVDDDHMLSFLRAEDFDVHLALNRLIRYWFHRYKTFGPDKFALPMTLGGAMRDHIRTLQRGWLTMLPVCDEASRPIIYINKNVKMPTTDEKVYMLWYLVHLAMQNPAVQKGGYVVLANSKAGKVGDFDPRFFSQAVVIIDKSFPLRCKVVNVHLCHVSAFFPVSVSALKRYFPVFHRRSIWLHNGSDERVLETLAEHGLPKHCVPTDLGGTLRVMATDFVRDRLTIEGGSSKWIESIVRDLSPGQPKDTRPRPNVTDTGSTATENFPTSMVQEGNHADAFNLAEAGYGSAEYGIEYASADLNESTSKQKTSDHSDQKSSESKRRNNNDPEDETVTSKKSRTSTKAAEEGSKANHGRKGDPRMNRAVQAKVDNLQLTLVEALEAGGFVFPNFNMPGVLVSAVKDTDNVTLYQRRNQLLRRLRYIKAKSSDARKRERYDARKGWITFW